MGISSLRRHKEEWAAKGVVPKATTIEDVMGEPMHSSGLTMREYNEIAKEVSQMTDKDILETVNDINKATTISVLEEVKPENNDIKRWENESPAVKENENVKETSKEGKEETQDEGVVSNSYKVIEGEESNPFIVFNDLVEGEPIKVVRKKRTYTKKTVME